MQIESIPGGLRVLAPAKLNLYLEVGPRRPDGYHDIDSLFQTVTLHDELTFSSGPPGEILLEEEGIAEKEHNIVFKAARRLLESGLIPPGSRPGARIRLKKGIPEGAGLGGGSSDAAAALVALSRLWRIWPAPSRTHSPELRKLALELGSDVPFFLSGGTARARGRGEQIESWSAVFDAGEPSHYVLAYPRCKVSTRLAYDALDAVRGPDFALTAPSPLDSMPPATVREHLGYGEVYYNRFEDVVFSAFPVVRSLQAVMAREPFVKVLMSGSGSTVYGVARSAGEARRIADGLKRSLTSSVPADVYVVESERAGS